MLGTLPVRKARDFVRGAPPAGERAAPPLARIYATYAAAFLCATLLSGVWLRASFVEAAVLGGFSFGHALHAHTHLAFFGWTTMALMSLLSARSPLPASAPWLRWHAHLTGLASAAAFVGFLLGGYNAWTIGLSVVHVTLWMAFAVEAWKPLEATGSPERAFYRSALALLLLAGAGALTPGFVMARGISDPWIGQIAVHSFLTPFVAGWLMLGVMGGVYGRIEAARYAVPALAFTLAGVLPSALLHPIAPPPADGLILLGRAGMGLVGIGTALFGWDVLRAVRATPLLQLVGLAALLKGTLEITVGAGIGVEMMTVRSLTVSYVHLVLLGIVTPALLVAGMRMSPAPARSVLYAGGLALMLAALAALGLPALLGWLVPLGIEPPHLYRLALVGGAACALAVLLLLPTFQLRSTTPGG